MTYTAISIEKRIKQKEGHCGPASLVMMLSTLDRNTTQDDIVEAAGISDTVRENGSRIDQLARAINLLFPDIILLAKYYASIEDAENIIRTFRVPIGVEWQGVFSDPQRGGFEEGHYSVMTGIDLAAETVTLVDPEPRSALVNDQISIEEFEKRWWDENDVPALKQGKKTETIRNARLLFVVIPKSESDPYLELGLMPATLSLMREYCTETPERKNGKQNAV